MRFNEQVIDIVIPVYNDTHCLENNLHKIVKEGLPKGWRMKLYIVDDGSEKPVVLPNLDLEMTLVRLTENNGRSSACNAGVEAGTGGLVYIIDVDCVLEKGNVIDSHIRTIKTEGADISCGPIYGSGNNFWSHYQNNVVKRRSIAFDNGDKASHTTANLMLKRKVYEAVGGFNEAYSQYGFEDKDLLLRLLQKGYNIKSNEATAVEHKPDLSLNAISKKMETAGRYGSMLFKSRHAEYYANGRFGSFDLAGHWVSCVAPLILKPSLKIIVIGFDFLEKRKLMPYFLGNRVVKLVSGLGYALGTCQAK